MVRVLSSPAYRSRTAPIDPGDEPNCSRYLDIMDPAVVASARRHGISDDDMLHAYRHPARVFVLSDLVMLVGADTSGRLLEVGVAAAAGMDFIIHAMAARPRFLE